MALKAVYTSDNRDVKAKYNTIIAKLQATVAKHKAAFPQLPAIKELLDVTLPETDKDENYLQRLQELCSYLYELSVGSYVIRHLHYNLTLDVEAVKHRNALISQEEHYLLIPK
ncbi:hypothetical protein GCM10027443_25350 [Pontibacter brevis]